ncbi:DNA-3-methyladenine glycosylase [Streptomyces sp. ICBB 8177]|uniref:DNA-3-methyladenine glycosylase family protein n=1 Tax=Streptomyces sp. ICBB 8177 TaxID=563922 RepID=UPI000D683A0A|nr:DNA-3-methyladenine glycosylase [Streptomyces sp. ICBB 8177]PWI42982.1 Fe-S cluster assembly protein HesB [Streptomyces sp. ICBB 8177]
MPIASFAPEGPFSLASSIGFLEGFTPASYDRPADGVLRLAFPADDGRGVIGCAVAQEEAVGTSPGTVSARFTLHRDGRTVRAAEGTATHAAVRDQIARILSLDVDATGFPALAATDPVVAGLQADYPGMRPVCFHSPYEAAAWAVIGHRVRRSQAAAVKARLARDHGQAVDVAGQRLYAFPTPEVLRGLGHVDGLTGTKTERLRAIAEAALDGRLDAAALRAQPAEFALTDLRELPGIGPFSAELVLIRGAGHPDVFPAAEPRVHQAVAAEYGLDADAADDPARLARIADAWRPYRSWVATLLRVRAQDRATGRG